MKDNRFLLCWLFFLTLIPASAQQGTEELMERWNRLQDYPRYTAYRVLGALVEAYPGVITDRSRQDGDWTCLVGGTRFYWAGGRMLPEEALPDRERYAPYPFYRYPSEYEPELMLYLGERQTELDALLEARESRPLERHPGFYNSLYRISDENSAWNMMKTVYFMGFKVTVHRDIMEDLARVEERLLKLVETDRELKTYLDSLEYVAGYSWRVIAGTASRSNHCYGFAVDFLPFHYGGKNAYWRWSRDFYDQWYNLDWDKRYRPPEAFVRAFEEEGFVWGGKWLLFDSIHFEYRPEIKVLNRPPDLSEEWEKNRLIF
ncbi:MAG: M15 family metallopeptidase [Spirochaetales bacterium]|nr:M15 family metallopeptidase [Spirochaetales bacterium]